MNTETFFQQFELLADAPNGIQKLRELILQLAVQGKLVPQNPDDEPAAVLLERIKAEKERLVKEGKIKKSKKLSDIKQDEISFKLPDGWVFQKIDYLCFVTKLAGFEYTKHIDLADVGEIPVIRAQNVRMNRIDDSNLRFIDRKTSELLERSALTKPAILMTFIGAGIGDAAIFQSDKRWHLAPNVAKLEPFNNYSENIDINYLLLCLMSPSGRKEIFKYKKSTAQPSLSMGTIRDICIVIPPLAEQKRIVEKVDRLMELCDRLETQQQQQQTKTLQLGTVATSRLTTAKTPEAFKQHWQNISNNFDLIYSTPENIKQLRQTILQLAVMGKLVPQNPDDEPASVLLAKIKAEKEKLIKEGKIKKSKKSKAIAPDEIPYDLPNGWEWVRFGDLITYGIRNGYSPKAVEYITPTKTLMLSATTSGVFDHRYFKYIDKTIESDSHLWLENGDLLIQRANSIEYVGVAAIYEGKSKEFIYPDLMMKVKLSNLLDAKYIHRLINSKNSRIYWRTKATGTSGSMPKINQLTVNSLPVSIPPLAEQHRIVAKVDQLMNYCDELEAKLTQSLSDKEKLMNTAVYQLLTA